MYTNREALASLREGVIPQGWEDTLELRHDGRHYWVKEGALEWLLLSSSTRLALRNPLGEQLPLYFILICSDNFPQDNYLNFGRDGLLWASSFIPPEDFVEALTKFVTLADFCTQPADELTEIELAEREQEIETFLTWWQERFSIDSEYLAIESNETYLEAHYTHDMYAFHIKNDYEWFSYALTKEQFETLRDACLLLAPEERFVYATEYVATLGKDVIHVLQLRNEGGDYLLSDVYHDNASLLIYIYTDEENIRRSDSLPLSPEQHNALAAEWLWLSPAERTAPMREAFERLSGKRD
ncbi:MAG: hypothetical protein FWD25_01565 [Clostridia bacterium]|nr:hypothetical protein [Clostridia bacterium]